MRLGTLRHRVNINTVPTSKSTTGADTAGTPTLYAREMARIEPLQGEERFTAGREATEVTHRLTIRHRAGVIATMQAEKVVDGRVFDIVSVISQDERGRWMQLMCRERRTDATP